ncbi:MAG: tetratricopeptide repeat protein [Synechococcus sp.]
MVVALGVGWLLNELIHGQSSASPSRVEVDRQVSALLNQREQGPLSAVDERRLLERLLALGRLQESIVLVEDQLAAQPKAWRWRLLLSQLELRNGNSARAEAQLQHLAQLQPANPDVLEALALLRIQQGRSQEAISTVQTALSNTKAPSKRVPLGLLLADLQRQSGSADAALSTYEQLINDAPDDVRPSMAKALLLQEQGQLDQALALLASARTKQVAINADTEVLDALATRWGLISQGVITGPETVDPLKEKESVRPSR